MQREGEERRGEHDRGEGGWERTKREVGGGEEEEEEESERSGRSNSWRRRS